jgi:ribulose kinase
MFTGEVITNEYPKVMLVSQDKTTWYKRVVFMEKCNKFMAWQLCDTLEAAENELGVCSWGYAKDVSSENPKKQALLVKADYLIKQAEELKQIAEKI